MVEPKKFNTFEEALAPLVDTQEDPDTPLDVLEPNDDNILSLPGQEERPSSPSSSLRSVRSTGSQDEMVLSPTTPITTHIHQTEPSNITKQHEYVVNNVTRPETLPEIIISISDTVHPEEAQRLEVTTNDDTSSSELVIATPLRNQTCPVVVVTPPMIQTCLKETDENLDVSQNEESRLVIEDVHVYVHVNVHRKVTHSSSSQNAMSSNASRTQPQPASSLSWNDVVVHVHESTCTKTTLSIGSNILNEEDINNGKYNTEAAPITFT